eukprot:UN23885
MGSSFFARTCCRSIRVSVSLCKPMVGGKSGTMNGSQSNSFFRFAFSSSKLRLSAVGSGERDGERGGGKIEKSSILLRGAM